MGINIDPLGVVGTFVNADQASKDRDLSYRMTQDQMKHDTFKMQWQQQNLEKEWQRQDTRLARHVEDAQRAGLSPLAALGIRGSSPSNITIPTTPRGQLVSHQMDYRGLMQMSITADIFKKLAERGKAKSETPKGQKETTYPTISEIPVEHSETMVRNTDNRPPMVEMRRGPGGKDMPISTTELEEYLFGQFLQSLDGYLKNEPQRKMWDSLRKKPDRTGRFGYMEKHDDAGSISP